MFSSTQLTKYNLDNAFCGMPIASSGTAPKSTKPVYGLLLLRVCLPALLLLGSLAAQAQCSTVFTQNFDNLTTATGAGSAFYTDPAFSPSCLYTSSGPYALPANGVVGKNQTATPNGFTQTVYDHTTSSGNYLLNLTPSSCPGPGTAWGTGGSTRQPVTVTAGLSYTFKAYAAGLYTQGPDAVLKLRYSYDGITWTSLNGTGADISPTSAWTPLTGTFTPTQNSVYLDIYDVTNSANGNDFGLDDISFTPNCPNADLSITKTGPATVSNGGAVSYSLLVTNNGPAAANGATVSDPAVANYTATGITCIASGGAVCPSSATIAALQAGTLTIPTLPVNGSLVFTVTGTAASTGGSISNTATVSPPSGTSDPTTTNNSSTATTGIGCTLGTIAYSQNFNDGHSIPDGTTPSALFYSAPQYQFGSSPSGCSPNSANGIIVNNPSQSPGAGFGQTTPTDHTTGSGTYLMVGTSCGVAAGTVWAPGTGSSAGGRTAITVTPGTTYTYSAYAATIVTNPAAVLCEGNLSLRWSADGVTWNTISGPTQLSYSSNAWQPLTGTFTPTTSSIYIDIYNSSTCSTGNDFGIDDISLVATSCPTTLPITLTNFSGVKTPAGNLLSWSASNAVNFANFELQRSSNGSSFATIATVAVNASGSYSYTDAGATGTNYYRLAMVDLDGSIQYSKTVAIVGDGSSFAVASIYPNPANSQLNVALYSPTATNVTYTITDISGRVMGKEVHPANAATTQAISVSNLARGTYLITVDANGTKTTSKFTKL